MVSTNSHLSAFFGSAEEREDFKEDDGGTELVGRSQTFAGGGRVLQPPKKETRLLLISVHHHKKAGCRVS